eukprot:350098-Chlamydomonas_euryale.AAC.3
MVQVRVSGNWQDLAGEMESWAMQHRWCSLHVRGCAMPAAACLVHLQAITDGRTCVHTPADGRTCVHTPADGRTCVHTPTDGRLEQSTLQQRFGRRAAARVWHVDGTEPAPQLREPCLLSAQTPHQRRWPAAASVFSAVPPRALTSALPP